ncbi:histidine--tRNA ligase [Paenibacillus sp. HJGM_3]|uniref:histidine--tRNA ligase n=1 Tax=Paenibacillus sp. HJGM_3 TaxID=3379816 RepID=UPI0038597582
MSTISKLQNVKGTFDYFGQEQALRRRVQKELETLFELYDFDSMETPMLNELELLASKYAGGEEILKEMYQLSDQGQRRLGLRYDLTVPFAKVMALYPGLELPFKRYEIGKVFRDGPVKRGRLREFLQCDADVVGIAGPEAEAELMQLAVDAFRKLNIPIVIRWNNRRFIGELLGRLGVRQEADIVSVLLTLDKLAKIGLAGVRDELREKGLQADTLERLEQLVLLQAPSLEELAERYGLQDSPGTAEARALQELLNAASLADVCRFDPFLSRGLTFYTGTVYEIFDATGAFASSLGSGGRYDAIIGQLIGREDLPFPAVGLSFGMESIMALLKERQMPEPAVPILIVPIGDTLPKVLAAAAALRRSGLRVRLETRGRKLRKLLPSAAAQGIRYVMLIGETETESNQVRLKDMRQATEDVLTLEKAVEKLTAMRSD